MNSFDMFLKWFFVIIFVLFILDLLMLVYHRLFKDKSSRDRNYINDMVIGKINDLKKICEDNLRDIHMHADMQDVILNDMKNHIKYISKNKCDNDYFGKTIKVKKLDNYNKDILDDVPLPYKGTIDSAGFDLYATHVDRADPFTVINENNGIVSILPGTCILFGTSLAMEIPKGYYLDICSRSGLSINEGLAVANSPARIDSDYRGEIIVAIRNLSNNVRSINIGDRIAQCTLHKIIETNFKVSDDELSETERGEGKLGSTGKK